MTGADDFMREHFKVIAVPMPTRPDPFGVKESEREFPRPLVVHRDGRVTRGRGTGAYLVGHVHRDSAGLWRVQRVSDGGAWFPRRFRTRRDALRVFAVRPGSIADGILGARTPENGRA